MPPPHTTTRACVGSSGGVLLPAEEKRRVQQSAAGGGLTTQRRSKMGEQARGSRRTDFGSIAAGRSERESRRCRCAVYNSLSESRLPAPAPPVRALRCRLPAGAAVRARLDGCQFGGAADDPLYDYMFAQRSSWFQAGPVEFYTIARLRLVQAASHLPLGLGSDECPRLHGSYRRLA